MSFSSRSRLIVSSFLHFGDFAAQGRDQHSTAFSPSPDTFCVFLKSSRPNVSIDVTTTHGIHSLLLDLRHRFRAAKKVSGRHVHVRPAHTHALHRFVLGGSRDDHERVGLVGDG
jgi:hypothetical protein